jgi:RNA polymerase sigma factor (sigma-70 family)
MNERDHLQELCRQAIRKLSNDFDWRLLISEDELATKSLERLTTMQEITPTKAREVTRGVYSETLYKACNDPVEQEQAYKELYRYLYKIALNKQRDIAKDVAQEALALTFEKMDQCHTPKTFLGFVYARLLDASRRVKKIHRWKREVPMEESLKQTHSELDNSSEQPEERILHKDEIQAILNCLQKLLQGRAHGQGKAILQKYRSELEQVVFEWDELRRQLEAILQKYRDERSDEEIAQSQNTTPGSVRTRLSRGMAKMRKCLDQSVTSNG